MYNSFKPGAEWCDTDGNLIQAHGGYMFYENGTYYWYGENKEKSQSEFDIWHWGVRLYSSTDLYNWKSEGIILEPETEDETSSLYFNTFLDRPHILYNEKTKKYVMWIKVMTGKPETLDYAVILTADSIKGPYKIVRDHYNPNGFGFGDFEIVKDGNDAYVIYERPHSELVISPLTDDYLSAKDGNFKTYFHNGHPPFIREAPATFKYKDKLYMITSGTTAKFPNPSETAVSDTYMGDWQVIGDPHVNDAKHTSFDSQISCIFKVQGKDNLFIAMADRWLMDLPNNMPDVCKVFDSMFNPNVERIPFNVKDYTTKPTSIARYVWLPIEFDGDVPTIKWYDEWKWEDF